MDIRNKASKNKDETDRLGISALTIFILIKLFKISCTMQLSYSYTYTIVMVTAGRDGTKTDTDVSSTGFRSVQRTSNAFFWGPRKR